MSTFTPVVIKLSADNIQEARSIADIRQGNKEHYTSTRKMSDGNTSWEGHFMGIKGELALARHIGCDLDYSHQPAGDKGVDFIVNGWRIDAQTTKWNPPDLKYDVKHPLRADIAVLVRMKSDKVTMVLAGWITREEFDKNSIEWDYHNGQGVKRIVRTGQLRPIKTLLPYCSSAPKAPAGSPC